jgi:cobalamin-dependent methionine synthase I
MKGSEEIVVFLGTLGEDVDRNISRLMAAKKISDSYILDAMASVAAESMVERFYQRLKDRYEANEKSVTLRFSPGYCDWPLREQKKIFKFLPNDTIGVNLSKNLFMSPRKSVSGIVGVCPSNLPAFAENPCLVCTKYDCPYRRTFSRQ